MTSQWNIVLIKLLSKIPKLVSKVRFKATKIFVRFLFHDLKNETFYKITSTTIFW